MSEANELKAIKARHEEAEKIYAPLGKRAVSHIDRATLLRLLDAAQEEISTWQSVFPDIAPDRVLPDRSKLEGALLLLAEENIRMRGALQEIADRHIPDQPAANDIPEADYIRSQYTELRLIARRALSARNGESSQ